MHVHVHVARKALAREQSVMGPSEEAHFLDLSHIVMYARKTVQRFFPQLHVIITTNKKLSERHTRTEQKIKND